MLKRRIHIEDPSRIPDTPPPPILRFKITKVFLGPKHIREMVQFQPEEELGKHWQWDHFHDNNGNHYASASHGRNKVWYEVEDRLGASTSNELADLVDASDNDRRNNDPYLPQDGCEQCFQGKCWNC